MYFIYFVMPSFFGVINLLNTHDKLQRNCLYLVHTYKNKNKVIVLYMCNGSYRKLGTIYRYSLVISNAHSLCYIIIVRMYNP